MTGKDSGFFDLDAVKASCAERMKDRPVRRYSLTDIAGYAVCHVNLKTGEPHIAFPDSHFVAPEVGSKLDDLGQDEDVVSEGIGTRFAFVRVGPFQLELQFGKGLLDRFWLSAGHGRRKGVDDVF